MSIQIRRLSYALGAEVLGLALTKPLDKADIKTIKQAWLDHLLLVVRDQNISPADHIRFGEYFGQVEDSPLVYYRHPEHAKILLLTNENSEDGKPSQTRNAGRHWHSDLSYTTRPAEGALLLSRKIPDVGVDTMFSNMYMAFDRLTPTFQEVIRPLYAVHDMLANTDMSNRDPEQVRDLRRRNPVVGQPIVRIHPETGKPALYVSEQQVVQIVGMTREESAGILQYLAKHTIRPEFTYRHRWKLHDIVMWDNRCTMHLAVPDNDHSQPRVMHRVTLTGTPSGEVIQGDPIDWRPSQQASAAA